MGIIFALVLFMVSLVSGDSELFTFLKFIRKLTYSTKVTFKFSNHVTFPDHARSMEHFALILFLKNKPYKLCRSDVHFRPSLWKKQWNIFIKESSSHIFQIVQDLCSLINSFELMIKEVLKW